MGEDKFSPQLPYSQILVPSDLRENITKKIGRIDAATLGEANGIGHFDVMCLCENSPNDGYLTDIVSWLLGAH